MKSKQTGIAGFLTPTAPKPTKKTSKGGVTKKQIAATRKSNRHAKKVTLNDLMQNQLDENSRSSCLPIMNALDTNQIDESTPVNESIQIVSDTSTQNTSINVVSNDKNLNRSIGDLERSLDDVIVNALNEPVCQSSPNSQNSHDIVDELDKVKADLSKTKKYLKSLRAEHKSLSNQNALLMEDMKTMKKTITNLTKENKKLTTSNDKFRKQLSTHQGMRRFAKSGEAKHDNETQTSSEKEPHSTNEIEHKIDIVNAKIDSLVDQIKLVGDSITTNPADEEDGDFIEPRKRRRNRQNANIPITVSSNNQSEIIVENTHTNTQVQPIPVVTSMVTQGQPIPVVTLGVTQPRSNHQLPSNDVDLGRVLPAGDATVVGTPDIPQVRSERRPSYRDVASGRVSPADEVVVVGTSITRGVGRALHDEGISATTYTYPGATIPYICDRLKFINLSASRPKTIVVQAGGNDCAIKPLDQVKYEYGCLVNEIKYLNPEAKVILSSIPPRKASTQSQLNIAGLNEKIRSMSDPSSDIHCINVSPVLDYHYKPDKIHFSDSGLKSYACKMGRVLKNFHGFHQRQSL